MILTGKKIILRYPRVSDAKWLFKKLIRPEILLMLEPQTVPRSVRDETKWIREQPNRRKTKNAISFVVVDKNSGELLGTVGLHAFSMRSKRAEAGAWIAKEYWGKGYAKEALTLLINYGFKKLKLNRIEGVCFDFNKRSRRLQESLGFKLEGVLREHSVYKGKFANDCFYSLLKKEWKG